MSAPLGNEVDAPGSLKVYPRPRRAAEACSHTEPVDARMVALMRLLLASSVLAIIYIDPSEPDRLVQVTYAALALYTLFGYLTAPGGPEFELNRFLLRPVYLVALGYMIAYGGGREVTFKRRLAFLKEVSRLSNPRFGVDQTVCSIMERLRAFYGADACLLVLSAPGSDDCLVRRAVRDDPERALRPERVPAEYATQLPSPPTGQAVVFNRRTARHPSAPRPRTFPARPDPGLAKEAEALSDLLGGSYVSIPLRARDMMAGRFHLVSAPGVFGGSDVDFLRQVAEQVQPVVENIQLLDNLATEASRAVVSLSRTETHLRVRTRSVKRGATIPIKIRLVDASGANVSSPAVVVSAIRLVLVSGGASDAIISDRNSANGDGNFRDDASLGGYIFNLSTKNMGLIDGTWRMYFAPAGDPTAHPVLFGVVR